MLDETLIAQLNAGYVCPPDAGPAWRAACEDGIDMALIEDALRLSPWARLLENDGALQLVRELEQARIRVDGSSHQNP